MARNKYAENSGQVGDSADEYWNVEPAARNRGSAWAGWVLFAGILMIIMGSFNAIQGLVALFQEEFYVVGPYNVLVLDLTGWGWLHLIVGTLVAATGIALSLGVTWARWVTVGLAALEMIIQIAFIGVYPVWSTIVIALCVVVIWAILVHGAESQLDL